MEIILSEDDLKKLSKVIKDLPIRSLKIGWGKRITIEVEASIPYADGNFRRLFLTYLLIYKCVRKSKIVFEFLNLTSRMLPYEDEKLVRQTIISLLPKGVSVKDAEITVNWKNPEILSLLAQKLSITKIRFPSNSGIIETASSHCYELDRDTFDIIEYQ